MSTQRPEALRTVFMGTPELAVPALRCLHRHSDVGLVVSNPDRPAGRGRRLRAPPVKLAAEELGLPVWQPETLRGVADDPRLQGYDLFVVMAYGRLLPEALLRLPAGDCVNLHCSLLPRWRGASPLQAAIRAGDRETGACVMRMVRALDAGPVYCCEHLALDERVDLPWLHDRMAELAARALERFLTAWPDCQARPQDERAVTWCGKLTADDGRLDFRQPCRELDRQLRAYTPVPGCCCLAGEQRLRIWSAEPRPAQGDLAPGATRAQGDAILVGCGDGALAITRLQPPGTRAMSARDFLNGRGLPERLH